MTNDNAAYKATAQAGVTADHYPACGRCGNLCGLLARVCADCGARLHPTEGDLRLIAEHGSMRPVHAAPELREAPDPTNGTGA